MNDEELKLASEISILNFKNKECAPSMRLFKTFGTFEPNYLDFLKEFEKNKNLLNKYLDTFLSVLAKTDKLVRNKNFSNCQMAAVFEIFYSCLCYLAIIPKIEKNKFLEYFRQSLLLYTVNDPPECLRIFNAIHGFDVAKIFHEIVVMDFELIRNKFYDEGVL